MKKNNSMYIHNEITHNVIAPSIILPLVFNIIKPKSVLDIGCGIGTWLSIAKELGISNVL